MVLERVMTFQKQCLFVLLAIAIVGTILNWIMNVYERNVLVTSHQIEIRIQQIQEECKRRIVDQREFVKQEWNKKLREYEAKSNTGDILGAHNDESDGNINKADRTHDISMDLLKDENRKLKTEIDFLRLQLQNATKMYAAYNFQEKTIEKTKDSSANDKIINQENQKTSQEGTFHR